jgi:hypothetical protein
MLNKEHVKRYRAKHRRFDYVPNAEALAVISQCYKQWKDLCFSGVIDRLVMAGNKAISGQEEKTASSP